MRNFLTIILTLQFLASFVPLSDALNDASLAKVSSVPAALAFVALIIMYITAICMMYGGASQAEDGKTHNEPKPDNAHGGWWNLGRFDILLLTVLLAGVCAYGINFSQLSYYSLPDSYFRPLITVNELPGMLVKDGALWLASFALVFLLSLLVRACRKGKPGSRGVATFTALVALVGVLFGAASMHALSHSGQLLASPGSIFVIVSTVCCYKAVRCVSLRCLLPEWAGGWHEGGLTPELPGTEAEEKTAAEEALPAQPVPTASALPQAPVAPTLPMAATAPLPAAPAQPSPHRPRVEGKYIRYGILLLLAMVTGIFMAEWSYESLRGVSASEGRCFGLLFGLSVLLFGSFLYDAFCKAWREYRAERAEKALPYALLAALALALWFALFAGIAALMR